MNDKIKTALVEVQYLRAQIKCSTDQYENYCKEFNESTRHLLDCISANKAFLAQAETNLRELAIDSFDGVNKTPFPGVGIQEKKSTNLDYDSYEALKWAKEHDMFLALDNPGFQAYCKLASDVPDCVAKTEETTLAATIDKDLTAAIEALKGMNDGKRTSKKRTEST